MEERIVPVVLVGGRSVRFGRDKLREPLPHEVGAPAGALLVDRPIAALRAVFGPVVAVVGKCDAAVAGRADRRIEDRYPGAGPIGGIVSALEGTGGAVFVLAGDLAWITEGVVRRVVGAPEVAGAGAGVWAILGKTDRLEPCVGIYRQGATDCLRAAIMDGRRALHLAIPPERLLTVHLDAQDVRNVNSPRDLSAPRDSL
jgi:molybdopterin-guanine dinucleotide biosynthesis protein A